MPYKETTSDDKVARFPTAGSTSRLLLLLLLLVIVGRRIGDAQSLAEQAVVELARLWIKERRMQQGVNLRLCSPRQHTAFVSLRCPAFPYTSRRLVASTKQRVSEGLTSSGSSPSLPLAKALLRSSPETVPLSSGSKLANALNKSGSASSGERCDASRVTNVVKFRAVPDGVDKRDASLVGVRVWPVRSGRQQS